MKIGQSIFFLKWSVTIIIFSGLFWGVYVCEWGGGGKRFFIEVTFVNIDIDIDSSY